MIGTLIECMEEANRKVRLRESLKPENQLAQKKLYLFGDLERLTQRITELEAESSERPALKDINQKFIDQYSKELAEVKGKLKYL